MKRFNTIRFNTKRFNTKTLLIVAAAATWLAASAPGFASAPDGFVTPTEFTITVTSFGVDHPSDSSSSAFGSTYTVWSGSTDITLKKADTGFTTSSIGTITVPAGRYAGTRICYDPTYKIKINGEKYIGVTNTIANGDNLYTTGTDGTATGALVTSAPGGGATTVSYTNTSSGSGCNDVPFAHVYCVGTDSSECKSTDTFINISQATISSFTVPIDLAHMVVVDSTNQDISSVSFIPSAMIGTPGASVHLSYTSGTAQGDLSIVLDSDMNPAGIYGFNNQGTNPGLTGMCTGGLAWLLDSNNAYQWPVIYTSSTGQLQYAAQGSNSNEGIMTIGDVKTAASSTTAVSCVADSAATPAYLNLSYTSRTGPATAGSLNWTVQRVVDPSNNLGNGTCSPCGSYQ